MDSVVRNLKIHPSPPLQSSLQNPSLISHFAWEIFAQSGASANAWIKRSRTCPIWSIVPPGAVFLLFLFTEGTRPCGVSFHENDRFSIDLNSFYFWGISAIGEILIFVGKLPLKISYHTRCAWFGATFSFASAAKWAIASSAKFDSWVPLITAAWVSFLVQFRPVFTGHPLVESFCNVS